MSKDIPPVTIVALCYNHSKYLEETLSSILNQTYPHVEVIVIDDASRDDSVSVLLNWLSTNAPCWKSILHQKNQGICKSLNESLRHAKGKYFKAIACDDVLMPHFIDEMVANFEQLPDNYALIYSDVLMIDEQSQIFGTTPFQERGWDTQEKIPSGKVFDQLAGCCFVPAPGTMMRTNVLQKIRFDESLLYEDWDMWLSIAKTYQIKGVNLKLVKYRIHQNSMYQTFSAGFIASSLKIAKKHIGYSKTADIKLKRFIIEWSLKYYLKNGKKQTYWLWCRYKYDKNLRNLSKVILSVAGIRNFKYILCKKN